MSEQTKTNKEKQGLTKKQKEIKNFIQNFISSKGFSPSYREIMERFGFSSTATVHKYINILKRKNILVSEKNSSRSLAFAQEEEREISSNTIEIPFIGHLSEGLPIETFSKYKSIPIPPSMTPKPKNSYILRIRGDSMSEEMMCDGDLLIVEARQEAVIGEIIVAIVNESETLVKYYHPENEYVKLKYSSPIYQPIIVRKDSLFIQGVVVGLIRMY